MQLYFLEFHPLATHFGLIVLSSDKVELDLPRSPVRYKGKNFEILSCNYLVHRGASRKYTASIFLLFTMVSAADDGTVYHNLLNVTDLGLSGFAIQNIYPTGIPRPPAR